MAIIFLFFGYQKWFEYEAQALLPYISHGPLIFWMYAVFGVRGATYLLGVAEWLVSALLFAGYWNKRWGIPGSTWLMFRIHCDHHDHSVYAGRLGGFRRRIPGDDREGRFPYE